MSEFENRRVEKLLADYVARRRPAPHIRPELDLGWRRNGQSVEVFEVRPLWRGAPGETMEHPVIKATWVKSRGHWRVYWMRADLKWHPYDPLREASTFEAVLAELDADPYACFWG
ncbi:DUF3024 domain-containing protein [Luteimonas sp. XNQY3]|nr:DUF3024 domain-containing protein [Luteimonas sp. XNQY3]MCD9008107.1 DUF3024 domain-containing protein [Luteimonas sp. XNQY3]